MAEMKKISCGKSGVCSKHWDHIGFPLQILDYKTLTLNHLEFLIFKSVKLQQSFSCFRFLNSQSWELGKATRPTLILFRETISSMSQHVPWDSLKQRGLGPKYCQWGDNSDDWPRFWIEKWGFHIVALQALEWAITWNPGTLLIPIAIFAFRSHVRARQSYLHQCSHLILTVNTRGIIFNTFQVRIIARLRKCMGVA